MGLIHLKKGDTHQYVKVLYETKNKLWYYPTTGLMCTHEGVLVKALDWMAKDLYWGSRSHAPRQVLKALKVI